MVNDFTKQIYPEGKERWIKVKYLDTEKASQFIRLNTPISGFNNDHFGIEITSIGVRDEYTPQIESLLNLKAAISNNYELNLHNTKGMEVMHELIDTEIEKLLNEILISKQ